ncbi:MAG: hypothetical protein PUB32_07575 [Clostridiales bacterium]|nr:hypothetical protein [Clostridiales bacterium]
MKKWLQRLPDLRLKENRYLWYILVLPAFLIAFFALERFGSESYWVSYIPLDDRIPFCEFFVLPYVLWYPFLFGTGLFLMLKDHDGFKNYMRFIGIAFGLALLFCAIFPNGQDLRPEEFPRDNIFTWLIGLLYTADDNQNVLPSMHVLGSCAAASALCLSPKVKSRAVKLGAVLLAVLISVSTVFVKQHSALDIITAIPPAAVIFLVIYRPWRRKISENAN